MAEGYIVSRELMSIKNTPAVVIKPGVFKPNRAAYEALGGADKALIRLNIEKGKMAAVPYDKLDDIGRVATMFPVEDGWDSDNGDYEPAELSRLIYEQMGWDQGREYKMLGHKEVFCAIEALVFNLNAPIQRGIQ